MIMTTTQDRAIVTMVYYAIYRMMLFLMIMSDHE